MILNSHNASQSQSVISWHSSLASQRSHRLRARGVLAGKADTVTFLLHGIIMSGCTLSLFLGFAKLQLRGPDTASLHLMELEGGGEGMHRVRK